ncbi:MAG: hypothetical protein LBI89_02955, partial [Prevotellaceae bacterium]|nr:hypothetical protein [Prevotellaceae bacterium]
FLTFAAVGAAFKHKHQLQNSPLLRFIFTAKQCRNYYQLFSATVFSNFYRDFFSIPLKKPRVERDTILIGF